MSASVLPDIRSREHDAPKESQSAKGVPPASMMRESRPPLTPTPLPPQRLIQTTRSIGQRQQLVAQTMGNTSKPSTTSKPNLRTSSVSKRETGSC
jgi:hypothetical protein